MKESGISHIKTTAGLTAKIILALLLSVMVSAASHTGADAAEMTDTQVCSQVFDAVYYASHNPDVLKAVGTGESALLAHYMQNGIFEGRNASASFNATAYKNRYADLQAAYGNDMIKYVRHYVTCGKAENRDASPVSAAGASVSNRETAGQPTYTLLGTYTTKYNSKAARATNISIAAGHLNGTIVQPGQEFSYSNTILPRTVENGYVEAPVFVNKEHSMGIGGGICQVSSTLYACMKTIGLPATERHAHSLPVDYLPEGWDATVSGTRLDLKFVNTYSSPLMIIAEADSGRLTVSLWLRD